MFAYAMCHTVLFQDLCHYWKMNAEQLTTFSTFRQFDQWYRTLASKQKPVSLVVMFEDLAELNRRLVNDLISICGNYSKR